MCVSFIIPAPQINYSHSVGLFGKFQFGNVANICTKFRTSIDVGNLVHCASATAMWRVGNQRISQIIILYRWNYFHTNVLICTYYLCFVNVSILYVISDY